jgi:predicted nucleic-acid-binding protein
MIAIDTNIIVRFLTADDPAQFKKARALFQKEDIVIPITVVLETQWVLTYAYQFNPADIISAFRSLFGLPNVEVEDPIAIADALEWYKKGMDYADAIHLAKSRGAERFVTFDKKLIKQTGRLTDISAGDHE